VAKLNSGESESEMSIEMKAFEEHEESYERSINGII